MIAFTQLIAFLIPTLALNITPGPDLLYVFGHGVSGGFRSVRYAAFGVWAGYLVHVLLVSLGVATLLQRDPETFKIVKMMGACYLLWIGGSLILKKKEPITATTEQRASKVNLLRQGFLVSALNPKVAVFFLVYLPQFVDTAKGRPAFQLALLGFIFSITATTVNMSAGYFADILSRRFFNEGNKTQIILDRICGGVMIALGLRLVLFS